MKSSPPLKNSKKITTKKAPVAVEVIGIEFSRSTYSVQVRQGKELFVPIIEFDAAARLQDSICECEEQPCMHVLSAIEAIKEEGFLLHQRFERHLWHRLFYHLCEVWDGTDESFELTKSGFKVVEADHSVELTTKNSVLIKHIRGALKDRPEYNEHNSIKFSNLPSSELKAWSKGRPGPLLRYELSPWSDLAKLLFTHPFSSELHYEIDWEFLPSKGVITIDAKEYQLKLILDSASIEVLLDHLHTLQRDLLHSLNWRDYVVSIQAKKNTFKLIYSDTAPTPAEISERQSLKIKPDWQIGSWAYWKKSGLWKLTHEKIEWPQTLLPGELADLLNRSQASELGSEIWAHIKVHHEPVDLNYTVDFDEKGSLHVEPYMWELGDIRNSSVLIFEGWAFELQHGFQRLKRVAWHEPVEIRPAEVEVFIDQHLEWLQSKANFEIHATGIDVQLGYRVEAERYLEFTDELPSCDGLRHYGQWIYTKAHGLFWQKNSPSGITPGLKINWDKLESFLDSRRSHLDTIAHFWAMHSPLEGEFLRVRWKGNHLELNPYRVLKSGLSPKQVHWIGNYSYCTLEGAEGGFFKHEHERLPVSFRRELLLGKEDLDEFLEENWPYLQRYVEKVPEELTPLVDASLIIEQMLPKKVTGGALRLVMRLVSPVGSVSLSDVFKKSSAKWLFTPAGLIDRSSSLAKALNQMTFDVEQGIVEIEPLALLRLRSIIRIDSRDDGVKSLLGVWMDRPHEGPDLTLLQAQLRPYQEIGVKWMWQLIDYGLGALLCDDMGLGKTHQVMGVLAGSKQAKGSLKALVACPTSVIYHWVDKLMQFLPSLRVHFYHGTGRTLDPNAEIVITSYGILRMDESLKAIDWDVAVFDEVQLAKNARSRIWRACGAMKAKHKIGLSGTPIENSLKDLKALFDLIYPGYLPEDSIFKASIVHPIEKHRDPEALLRLRESIQPLVLRRSKKEVLTQLPDKMEEIGFCDMSLEQQQLYQSVLNRSREELVDQLQDVSQPIPYMHIFAVINSLKQICNHPACYWRNREVAAAASGHQSGKWNLFITLLQEALASGQKVVVFSQYLAMLDLIEEYLHAHHIHYSGLRGSTRTRGAAVKRFQEDPDCRVFVASLSAGGLGIELTSASVVIMYDRWWNRARENQAIDRVHRMGQTRGVQVFRLITKNTIEERIDQIIARKSQLMEEVTPVDDPSVLKRFSREELLELLKMEELGQAFIDDEE